MMKVTKECSAKDKHAAKDKYNACVRRVAVQAQVGADYLNTQAQKCLATIPLDLMRRSRAGTGDEDKRVLWLPMAWSSQLKLAM